MGRKWPGILLGGYLSCAICKTTAFFSLFFLCHPVPGRVELNVLKTVLIAKVAQEWGKGNREGQISLINELKTFCKEKQI